MTTKRCLQIKETKESKALKAMREFRGKSVRELATVLGISHASVHQFESGRADITDEYRNRFLTNLGFTQDEWGMFLEDEQNIEAIRGRCQRFLHDSCPLKLKKIYNYILTLWVEQDTDPFWFTYYDDAPYILLKSTQFYFLFVWGNLPLPLTGRSDSMIFSLKKRRQRCCYRLETWIDLIVEQEQGRIWARS